ncbi:azaleucine resistance protein AzlC [Apilactobacillus kunkeei]|uniref:AzlC family ABC transporter permease n=1 Tax=Apilactobacillus kunkeei TaxID=148814 RepID=UPI00059AFA8F|nr:AzlC family ABC transporter permease [Apilactobacillus kunkeei]KIM18449.1 azaleucine resistance protein AzlC [Apilactobacillus kunkeei]
MDNQLTAKAAIKDSIPTMFGYIGIGLAFGIIGKSLGFSPWLVAILSLTVYAGSAQFILVSMMALHNPVFSIVLAIFLVNSRMILMSITTAPYFKNDSMLKNILIGSFLTDESFALGMNKVNYTDNQLTFTWFNTANIVSYLTWAGASFVGAIAGSFFIHNPYAIGLDFALVAMFIGLLYLQVIAKNGMPLKLKLLMILITFIMVFIGLIFIPSNLLILLVTLITCLIGVIIKHVFF